MIIIVFHSCEFDSFPWRDLFAQHFCDEENDDGPEKASPSEEIDQGVTGGGKQVRQD
jgi:hypothetical protein